MICQFVPSDCRAAHLPAVAERIAVPAAPPTSGTTFDAAETTVWFWMVRIVTRLPGKLAATSKVSVIVPALFAVKEVSEATMVSVAAVPVRGVEPTINPGPYFEG